MLPSESESMTTAFALLFIVFVAAPAQDPKLPKPKQDPPAKSATPAPDNDAANKARDPLEVSVPTFPNASCPIMGKPISSVLYTDTPYGRIYICCKSCAKKIRQDPETAHKTAYPVIKKAGNTVCPVMGDANDGSDITVVLQGYEIALCCEDCVAEAQANPQITLAKALDPQVKDVGNATCPITGDAVAANAFCLVGDMLIHLSSPACVEIVKKDPKGALEKARKVAGEDPKDAGHGHATDAGGVRKPAEHDGEKHGG